jgi:hypothetical protein
MAGGLPAYALLSWVRQGLAAAIAVPDGATAPPPGAAKLTASVKVDSQVASPADIPSVAVKLRVYGPGDIRGIDQRLIVRTDPVDRSTGFEPNYFPFVEFGRADFPWLFTPAAATGQRLRPWICLVVVPAAAATGPVGNSQAPLPVLTVDAAWLPDLADVWATAHAQVSWLPDQPTTDQPPKDLIGAGSTAAVSRLLCFRRLDPQVRYLACVVPTFDLGRRAGLGMDVTGQDEQPLQPAWTSPSGSAASGSVELPVYYHWEFVTGDAGDFGSLMGLLEHAAPSLAADVGKRSMDVSQPGYGLPRAGDHLDLVGALQPSGFSPTGDVSSEFQSQLLALLNRAAASPTPLVLPPIYGGWPAGQATVPAPPDGAPVWLRELNLDPRYRVAASLGAMVVHHEQEQLMASAWDQLAHLRRANQVLRQAQFATHVASAIHRAHLAPLAPKPGRLLQITRPLHGRVVVSDPTSNLTLMNHIAGSAIPDGAVSPTLRRLTSPQGALARRLTTVSQPASGGQLSSVVDRLNGGDYRVAPPRKEPDGTILAGAVTRALVNANPTSPFADVQLDNATSAALEAPTAGWQRTAPAAMAVMAMRQDRNVDWGSDPSDSGIPAPPDFQNLGEASAGQRLGSAPPPELDPLAVAPVVPQAMIEPLIELAPQLVLPGLEHVPDNTLLAMEPDYRFIEAYLVGLNHEMGRELLWRGFPSERRKTYFSRFWSSTSDRSDIPEIAKWDPAKALGANAAGWSSPPLVLALRSALLRRYPSTSVYAQQAVLRDGSRMPIGTVQQPVLRARLGDAQIFGFGVLLSDALGNPGWFIVIEQHAQEPRFALSAANGNNANPATWEQASWSSLVAQDGDLQSLRYASMTWPRAGPFTAPLTASAGAPPLTWGANAAQMASILLRNPARVAIHASAILSGGN